jgi:hypothetical protein
MCWKAVHDGVLDAKKDRSTRSFCVSGSGFSGDGDACGGSSQQPDLRRAWRWQGWQVERVERLSVQTAFWA